MEWNVFIFKITSAQFIFKLFNVSTISCHLEIKDGH